MRLFLDCEFNGFRGELISMALVPEKPLANGEWYECLEPQMPLNEWVRNNVIPILGKPAISKSEFRASLLRYIQWFERPELVADWHSDIIHFCNILQGDNFKESMPFDGKFTIIQTPEGEPKPEIPHNALSDAKALRDWYLKRMAGI